VHGYLNGVTKAMRGAIRRRRELNIVVRKTGYPIVRLQILEMLALWKWKEDVHFKSA
jgi:hypothetical protein